MFIDSTTAQIWLPTSACAAFEQAFGITYDEPTGLYLVNSTLHSSLIQRNPNVTFTFGGTQGGSTVSITLPYGAFNLNAEFPFVPNGNSTPYFPLRRAANSTQYTLGRTFLQEAYIIADYDRGNFTVAPCNWDVNKINTPLVGTIRRAGATTFDSSDNSNSSGISAGAIAGIVIGIVAAVALIGFLVWFLRRRRNAEKKRIAELDSANHGFGDPKAELSADTSAVNGDGTFYGPQKGGDELAGEPIHELTAAERIKAQELDAIKTGKTLSEMEAGGEYYAPGGKLVGPAVEMPGHNQIYEMPGSDVHEMPAPQPGRDIKY
jgi:tetrahydromethanopterin S-methyltransferase subunit F